MNVSILKQIIIDFVTIASTGNATDFGDLKTAREYQDGGTSNSIRGVFAGGYDANSHTLIITLILLQLQPQEMQKILVI